MSLFFKIIILSLSTVLNAQEQLGSEYTDCGAMAFKKTKE
tara:strand:- start:122 stop:241 length:120 start_codon:yes stop_codon:yes gene_type:complete